VQLGAGVGGGSQRSPGADQGESASGCSGRHRPPGAVQPLRGEQKLLMAVGVAHSFLIHGLEG